jgi:hypothetical protein
MKLSEKIPSVDLARPEWPLYEQCAPIIGTILDNKVGKPHIDVYEHVRYAADEVQDNIEDFGDMEIPQEMSAIANEMTQEEKDILYLLSSPENTRRLNIIGDVGVGKTTFLKHLVDAHFGKSADFGTGKAIYVDWLTFSSSAEKANEAIKEHFVASASAELVDKFGIKKIIEIDDALFESSPVYAGDRIMSERYEDAWEKKAYITQCIDKFRQSNPVALTYERFNVLCADDRNSVVLIFDNIDHLSDNLLLELFKFFQEVQGKVRCLFIIGMRDHSHSRGNSMYREDKATPSWRTRLNPPNIRMMIDKRINHYLVETPQVFSKKITVGAGVLHVQEDASVVCKKLLQAPFINTETYRFICSYSNYSIRGLFQDLQMLVGSPCFTGLTKDFVLKDRLPNISVDETLIAFGLGRHLMFYPEHSPLFNPYSAGPDGHVMDKIVGSRILQFLDNRTWPISYQELLVRLRDWGYQPYAIESQVKAMVDKDLVWTSTGSPSNFGPSSMMRMSYRGHLYARKIARRSVFNYMMSFNVEAPVNHSVNSYRDRSELRQELQSFGTFQQQTDSKTIALRVLGLAELIAEAERAEAVELSKGAGLKNFRTDVSPTSVSIGIVDGLEKFLLSVSQKQVEDEKSSRYISPSVEIMKSAGEMKQKLVREFRNIFPK